MRVNRAASSRATLDRWYSMMHVNRRHYCHSEQYCLRRQASTKYYGLSSVRLALSLYTNINNHLLSWTDIGVARYFLRGHLEPPYRHKNYYVLYPCTCTLMTSHHISAGCGTLPSSTSGPAAQCRTHIHHVCIGRNRRHILSLLEYRFLARQFEIMGRGGGVSVRSASLHRLIEEAWHLRLRIAY